MKTAVYRLLAEAHRRNRFADSHERRKPILDRWLGLGTAAAYRPATEAGLMVFHNGRTPGRGIMGWLTLTSAGVAAMLELADQFAWPVDREPSTVADCYMLAGGLAAY